MRISSITNWAYGLTVVLTGVSGVAFLLAAQAAESERRSVEQHLVFDTLADDLAISAEKSTDEGRMFVIRREQRHLEAFRREVDEVHSRDLALQQVKALGASPVELEAIADAEQNISELDRLELEGVAAAASGDQAGAQALLFGPQHERAQAGVLGPLNHFRDLVNLRTLDAIREAHRESDRATLVAKSMLALTAMLFLGVLYFVLRRRVAVPLTRMTRIVARLARQDYAVDVPVDKREDEIGDMTQALQVFRQNGLERDRLEAERRADQMAKDCILQMMHRLQACETREELADVVVCFAPQTFPDLAGRLYVYDDDRNALSLLGSWLNPTFSSASFAPAACWGLRRGRPHSSDGAQTDVCCPHIGGPSIKTLCIPLTAQGDTIGLLYFEDLAEVAPPSEATRVYLELMSDNVALALANLRLRERLAYFAERDALTGLYNRRRLDDTLNLYAQQASPFVCIMVDIDFFKRFNDEFGHDAGDAVMKHVAQIMRDVVGDAGHAYRFGGEEFTILLPKMDPTTGFALAERLRAEIEAAPLAYRGLMLGHITVSLGLAVGPEDGTAVTVLRRADAALLQAKSLGRNRTVTTSRPANPKGRLKVPVVAENQA